MTQFFLSGRLTPTQGLGWTVKDCWKRFDVLIVLSSAILFIKQGVLGHLPGVRKARAESRLPWVFPSPATHCFRHDHYGLIGMTTFYSFTRFRLPCGSAERRDVPCQFQMRTKQTLRTTTLSDDPNEGNYLAELVLLVGVAW
jgi:hypothetical protein